MGTGRKSRLLLRSTLSAALTILLLEIALRLLQPHLPGLRIFLTHRLRTSELAKIDTTEELMARSPVGFQPGVRRAGYPRNSRGFRTGDYTGPRTPGTLRIMVLGDSFTDASGGVPFPEMWTSVLERKLDPNHGRRVEVFGLGVPGFSPFEGLRLWELEHEVVRPDLVVLALFVGNDFPLKSEGLGWISGEAARRSYLFRLGRNYLRLRRSRAALEDRTASGSSDESGRRAGGRRRELGLFLEVEAFRFGLVLDSYRDDFHEGAERIGEALRQLADQAQTAGQQFAVMIIPDEYQVNPDLLEEITTYLEVGPDGFDLDLPQRWLGEFLTEAGIPHLDLLPVFREESKIRRLYWARNTHWNIEGNQLAGELLARFLQDEGLLESATPQAPAPGPSPKASRTPRPGA